MITFRILQNQVRQLSETIQNSDIEDEEERTTLLTGCMLMYSHMHRWQHMLSHWNLLLRKFHIILKLRNQSPSWDSAQYCLPRKSQLLLKHILNEQITILKTFRVSKASFEKLCLLVTTGKDHGWPEKLEVLVFLYWLVSGAAYRVVAIKFGIPKSTANDIVHRILTRLLQTLPQVIYLPKQNEYETIGQGFAQSCSVPAFDSVVGCLDCFHIGIKPPKTLEQYYTNERMYHSIKCQIVCDHKGLIRDVFVGFPGSVHDSQVLGLSPICSKTAFPPNGYLLLADNAYPCMENPISILTPFPDQKGSGLEARFNAIHHKAWLIVSKTIGSMKSRWKRIFSPQLDASIRLAPKIAAACAIMHNIALINDGDGVLEMENTNVTMDKGCHREDSDFRMQFARKVSAQMCTPTPADHPYTM